MLRKLIVIGISAGAIACGGGSPAEDQSPSIEFDTVEAGLPPATHGAVMVTNDVPLSMNPGERLNVRVTMRNTGASSPTDDWLGNSTYRLYSTSSPVNAWGWVGTFVTSLTAVSNTYSFDQVIVAPAANPNATFRARMHITGAAGGLFGTEAVINGINVDAAVQRRWACQLNSTNLPATMNAGFAMTATFTVQNTGTGTWQAGTFCLRATDSPQSFWGSTICPLLPSAVAPGGTFTFSVPITAPSSPGTYTLTRQMFAAGAPNPNGGVGFFDTLNNCVSRSVVVGSGGTQYDAAVSSQNFPTQMTPNQLANVTVTMQNTGAGQWDATGFILDSLNTPSNLWNLLNRPVNAVVNPNGTFTFTLPIRAPAANGSYNHVWRMRKSTNPGAGFFGATINVPVTVNSCGNSSIDTGEQCDDGNTTSSDGCSSTCQIEQRYVDLGTTTSGDRRYNGSISNAQLQSIAIGDFNGSGPADLVVGMLIAATQTGTLARAGAGTVYGYAGGGAFFTGTTSLVQSASPVFTVVGADAQDNLGVVAGLMRIADVTGEGTGDVILSARLADGASNARTDCGELIVLQGGAGLTGYLNLRAAMLPAQVVANVIGPVASGNMRLLDARDVNGDGRADLLVGVPGASPGGRANAGQVYLLDGASISGTVDLSGASPLATWNGAVAGDLLGQNGAIGDYTGDGTMDVALGTQFSSDLTTRGGAVWGYTGPVSGTYEVSTTYSVRYRGGDLAEQIGSQVAIANVRGTATADLVIGGSQIYSPASAGLTTTSQRGGVLVFAGPVANGDTTITKAGNWGNADSAIFGQDGQDNLAATMAVGPMGSTNTLSDIAIGAQGGDGPGNARLNAGALYVVRGHATLPVQTDLSTTPAAIQVDGQVTNSLLSRTASGIAVGDLDGDGKGDVCVSSFANAGYVACFRSQFP